MIKKMYAAFAAMLFVVGTMNGQNSIKGIVTGEGDEPLIGATVMLEGTSFGAVTDGSGQFELAKLAEGKYRVVFSFLGYQSQTEMISLSSSDVEY